MYFITNILNKDCDINCDLAMNKKSFYFSLNNSFIEKMIDRYLLTKKNNNNVYSSYKWFVIIIHIIFTQKNEQNVKNYFWTQ
jgi:hypothetical protein